MAVIVSTHVTFAIRCPQCGQLETASVSRFELGGGRSAKVICSCGSHKLTVGMKQKQVWLQVPCYLCDGIHFMYDSPKRFWNDQVKQVTCSDTDLQLGVFGPENEVESYGRPGVNELDRLLEDSLLDEYFDHPEVMYQTLSLVHDMAEEGNLDCTCGNRKISVDIYPDRLELVCPNCGHHKSVLASSEEDLAALEQLPHMKVGDSPAGLRKGHKK